MDQVKKHWLDGPRRYNENGELQVGDEPVVANPAFRFGVLQEEKPRAVDGLKKSSTNGATFIATPKNPSVMGPHSSRVISFLPLWG